MRRTEQDILEELFESIYSGNPDSDTDEKDTGDDVEKDSDDDDEDDESTPCDKKDDDDSDDDSDDDGDKEDSDDDDDDKKSNPFGDSDSKSSNSGGPFTSKIRSLQKEFNKLLVDAFEKYAPECIEDALDSKGDSFGENIEDTLDNALSNLKGKILDDLGVESQDNMMAPAAMGSFDPLAGADKPMEISLEA